MAIWTEVTYGTSLAHVAKVEGCNITISDGKGAWFWLVS
jgi:hypothetical protein